MTTEQEKQRLLADLQKRGKIKIINLETGHVLVVRSIYEIPNGYIRKGRLYSPQEKEKMSKSAKARGAPSSAYRDKTGENNPMYGKKLKYINNGIITKRVPENQVKSYVLNGWLEGRLLKKD